MKIITVNKAEYLGDFKLKITFDDQNTREINFAPVLRLYATGDYAKYKKEKYFKEFRIESNNIVWGSDWDLIFPIEELYAGKINVSLNQTKMKKGSMLKSIQNKLARLKSEELESVERFLKTMSKQENTASSVS